MARVRKPQGGKAYRWRVREMSKPREVHLWTKYALAYVLVMAISALGKQLERWVNKSDQR